MIISRLRCLLDMACYGFVFSTRCKESSNLIMNTMMLSFPTHLNQSLPSPLRRKATNPSDQVLQITTNSILAIILSKIANIFLIPENLPYWSFSEATDNYPICVWYCNPLLPSSFYFSLKITKSVSFLLKEKFLMLWATSTSPSASNCL